MLSGFYHHYCGLGVSLLHSIDSELISNASPYLVWFGRYKTSDTLYSNSSASPWLDLFWLTTFRFQPTLALFTLQWWCVEEELCYGLHRRASQGIHRWNMIFKVKNANIKTLCHFDKNFCLFQWAELPEMRQCTKFRSSIPGETSCNIGNDPSAGSPMETLLRLLLYKYRLRNIFPKKKVGYARSHYPHCCHHTMLLIRFPRLNQHSLLWLMPAADSLEPASWHNPQDAQ